MLASATPASLTTLAASPTGAQATERRYWRERRAAAMKAGPLGETDVRECDSRIAALAEQARAARLWAAWVQQQRMHRQALLPQPRRFRSISMLPAPPSGIWTKHWLRRPKAPRLW